jgi:hypothetical protein
MSERIRKQQKFARDLGLLLTEGLEVVRRRFPTAFLRMAEGYVADSINTPDEVSPHRRDGGHFKRLAQDLVLDLEQTPVVNSDHEAWEILRDYWRGLDKNNRTGGAADANHFGVLDGGIA